MSSSTIRDQMVAEVVACHDNFLQEDDFQNQSSLFRTLSSYAMEFLTAVSHEDKFALVETAEILHDSVMNVDFDPAESFLAFECLAKYAHNLIFQPWRRDFHTLKLTSAYFVHNIRAYLENAERILGVMGYQCTDDNDNVMTLDMSKYNLNVLKIVAVDMVLASSECSILSRIHQSVSKEEPKYPLSVAEVFELRKREAGDAESTKKLLLIDIRKRQKAYQKETSRKSFARWLNAEESTRVAENNLESAALVGFPEKRKSEIPISTVNIKSSLSRRYSVNADNKSETDALAHAAHSEKFQPSKLKKSDLERLGFDCDSDYGENERSRSYSAAACSHSNSKSSYIRNDEDCGINQGGIQSDNRVKNTNINVNVNNRAGNADRRNNSPRNFANSNYEYFSSDDNNKKNNVSLTSSGASINSSDCLNGSSEGNKRRLYSVACSGSGVPDLDANKSQGKSNGHHHSNTGKISNQLNWNFGSPKNFPTLESTSQSQSQPPPSWISSLATRVNSSISGSIFGVDKGKPKNNQNPKGPTNINSSNSNSPRNPRGRYSLQIPSTHLQRSKVPEDLNYFRE